MHFDVTHDLLYIFSNPFLDYDPYHYRNCLVSRPLYFESLSVTLTEVFFSVGMDISMNRQLVSCLFLITMSGLWPLSQYLFVYIGICHKIVMLSCYCLGLMLIPFLICVYIHLFADVPVEVWPFQLCWCVYVFSIGQLRAPCHNMVNSFLKLTTNPVHWVCAIF